MISDVLGTYVLVDVVKATITRNEASNLLSVLDQLHTDTLTNGRVRLFGLKTTTEEVKQTVSNYLLRITTT